MTAKKERVIMISKNIGLVAFQQCRTTIFFILFYENSSLVKGKLRWNTLTNETKQQNQ